MNRPLWTSLAVAGLTFGAGVPAQAQVFIRVPFVRVQVGGGGVAVRAPFVRYYSPPPVYYGPPPVIVQPLPGELSTPLLPAPTPVVPDKEPVPDDAAPPPAQQTAVMTLEQFSKTFQPRAGSYEVDVLNPVTRQPAKVRFTLPEGTPRRVSTGRNHLEFVYGPRQFVRIEFDRDGALVTSR